MKRIGLLHLLLSHPKKKKRDEDAGDDRSNDRRFFLGGANGKHDPHDHGAHPANDHCVHEVFKQRGVGFVSGDGLGLILGHGIDQVACQIGRASCRERVYISVVAVSLKKKHARDGVSG